MAEQAVIEETRTADLKFSVSRSEVLPEADVADLDALRRLKKALVERETLPSLPMQLIEKYADIAVRHANLKRLGAEGWYAEIPGFQGVWANEQSEAETLRVLKEVVIDWTLLKIQHKDDDLPIIEEINLNRS
jgi:predicted RNase H-like HicB family nuclease